MKQRIHDILLEARSHPELNKRANVLDIFVSTCKKYLERQSKNMVAAISFRNSESIKTFNKDFSFKEISFRGIYFHPLDFLINQMEDNAYGIYRSFAHIALIDVSKQHTFQIKTLYQMQNLMDVFFKYLDDNPELEGHGKVGMSSMLISKGYKVVIAKNASYHYDIGEEVIVLDPSSIIDINVVHNPFKSIVSGESMWEKIASSLQ